MRVLVTGASGFVGQHVMAVLAGRSDEAIGWGFGAPEAASDTVRLDLRDAATLQRQDLRHVDAVIHLAALAHAADAFVEPAAYVTTNSALEINLFEALLKQQSFPRVLVISSGGVYAEADGPLTETSPVDPSSPYMVSKLTQELLGSYYMKRGFEVIVARPFNHFGPGQGLGFLVPDLCSQIVALERAGGGEIKVGDLSTSRDYTDVRDVAAAYHSLIHAGRPGGIYNVCSGESRTGEALLERLCQLSCVEISLARDPNLARPTDARDVRASNELIREHTEWTPAIPVDETLAETLEFWRQKAARGQLK